MFNFFIKKKQSKQRLTENERQFISTIIEALSPKYPLFKTELDLGTFVYVSPNKIGGIYSFVFGLNNDVWKKICNPSIPNYAIKNIKFLDANENAFSVDLYISEGLIIGYTLPCNINEVNFEKIDISNIWEKHFLNEDYGEIEHIIAPLTKEQLSKFNMIKNTFRVEINGSPYYTIHDIEDGNYIAVDKNGSIFKVTYDPFKIKRLHDTILELLEQKDISY